ncbi:MAG TPA: asparagine synthase (glutamine-hydrolyzing) [Candidatus Paceibacterota bacterium]|nr:asparagine synthase (glutamine-hydrolyzing) [Candidatus Paceibacterota bacterium]
MCAINGFTWEDASLAERMNAATAHRGPDATDCFTAAGISFGHNRLAIIDLSERSAQPMTDASGRYTLVFNGQIYNFKELKAELSEYPFRSEGDTEVILAAYARWGREAVKRLNGMFAFAIWDREQKELFLARDHAGIKPLYYAETPQGLIFSSEIQGILEHDIPRRLDRGSFGRYLRLLYAPGPATMFEGIRKLPAASYGVFKEGRLSIESYWDAHNGVETEKLSSAEWRKRLAEQVDRSVASQLVSDRPLGIYLSGGIDSSAVLDAASRIRPGIDTFSVGFALAPEEQAEKFNADFELARRTAAHYGTNHHEVLLSAEDAVALLEPAIRHLGQPIANATILPMFALARFTKDKATVVLGGDGGDELFGGYERYRLSRAASLYQWYVPGFLRSLLSVHPTFAKLAVPAGAQRMEFFMAEKEKAVRRFLSPDVDLSVGEVFAPHLSHGAAEFEDAFMEADRKTWLVDEALAMSDSMSMSAGVETRPPLLDRDMIELSAHMPLSEKVSLGATKIAFKDAFRTRLPGYLFDQPKRGWFSPGAKWLRREPFKSFAREVLSEAYYPPTASLFNWPEISRMLDEHVTGEAYHLNQLWAVLTFQVWAKLYKVTLN